LDRLLRHQDGGMSLLQQPAEDILRETGQQLVVVQAELAHQRTGTCQLDQLRRRQAENDLRNVFIDTQAVHARGKVFLQQALGKQQIGKVDFLNILKNGVVGS